MIFVQRFMHLFHVNLYHHAMHGCVCCAGEYRRNAFNSRNV